jgi:hypothetical protein
MKPGSYKLVVMKSGYRLWTSRLDVEAGKGVLVKASLAPAQ